MNIIWISIVGMCVLTSCNKGIIDLNFGPSPGDGIEDLKIEGSYEEVRKNCC